MFLVWWEMLGENNLTRERRKMMEEFQMDETNNYEKWCEQWREKFLKMDQEEVKKRLPELKDEGDWLTICHFERRLGVHKKAGRSSPWTITIQ